MAKKAEDGSDKAPTKAAMIRAAITKYGLKAKPDQIQQFIIDTYNVTIPKPQISQYKSAEKRAKGGKRKKATATAATPAVAPAADGPTTDQIVSVTHALFRWESQLGREKLREIIQLHFKQ